MLTIDGISYDPITTVERDALVLPPKGTTIYNLTTQRVEVNIGTAAAPVWQSSGGSGGGGIMGGSVNLSLSSIVNTGAAPSGVVLDSNQLVYTTDGIGGAPNPGDKQSIFQFIVPEGYGSAADLNLILSTSGPITTYTLSARINGVLDSTINAIDINTTAIYPAYESQLYYFGDTLSAGDVITLFIDFSGQNGMDTYLKGITFNYNLL
jgi:hypothetical protein